MGLSNRCVGQNRSSSPAQHGPGGVAMAAGVFDVVVRSDGCRRDCELYLDWDEVAEEVVAGIRPLQRVPIVAAVERASPPRGTVGVEHLSNQEIGREN